MLPIIPVSPTTDICGQCKMLYGASCCEDKGGGPYFPMSYGEAARIARHRKSTVKDSVVVRKVPDEEKKLLRSVAGKQISDLIVNGVGLYLPRSDGQCEYLNTKCTIQNYKPYLCATFPFKLTMGVWTLGTLADSGFCLGQDTVGEFNTAEGLKLFGETVRNLNGLHERWKRDLQSHAANMKRRK